MFFFVADFFSKLSFSKNSFRNTISVSNSLDLELAGCFFPAGTGSKLFAKIISDDTSRQRVKNLTSQPTVQI